MLIEAWATCRGRRQVVAPEPAPGDTPDGDAGAARRAAPGPRCRRAPRVVGEPTGLPGAVRAGRPAPRFAHDRAAPRDELVEAYIEYLGAAVRMGDSRAAFLARATRLRQFAGSTRGDVSQSVWTDAAAATASGRSRMRELADRRRPGAVVFPARDRGSAGLPEPPAGVVPGPAAPVVRCRVIALPLAFGGDECQDAVSARPCRSDSGGAGRVGRRRPAIAMVRRCAPWSRPHGLPTTRHTLGS